MAYIEKEKLIEDFKSKDFFSEQVKMLSSYIISTQPEADVVPVVRCRDCKHFCKSQVLAKSNLEYIAYCERCDIWTGTEDYCSSGERREASKVKPRRIPWEAD